MLAGVADEIRGARKRRERFRLLNATESWILRRTTDRSHQMPYGRKTDPRLPTQLGTAGASVKPAVIGFDLRWPNGENTYRRFQP